MHVCVAKIYQLLEEDSDNCDTSRSERHIAAASSNVNAQYLNWQQQYKNMVCVLCEHSLLLFYFQKKEIVVRRCSSLF